MNTYVVQSGDTMWKIARKHGIALDSLLAANPQVADPNRLTVGQVIQVPTGMGGGWIGGPGPTTKEKMTMPMPMPTPMPTPPVHMPKHIATAPIAAPPPMPKPTAPVAPVMHAPIYAPHIDVDIMYEHEEIIEQKPAKRPPYYIKCCVPCIDRYGNLTHKEVIYYPAGERVMHPPY